MTRCNTAFKSYIRQKCYDRLEREGFTRFAKEGVDWPLDPVFNCWVGLNTGLYPDRVEINPFIGVHAIVIERLALTMKGRRYDRGVATYAIPLGELATARDERAFAFTPNQSDGFVESEVQRLAQLCANVGLDYAGSIASYEALLPLLQSRLDMLGGYPERVACCLYLMGHTDRARSFTESFAADEPEYFEAFARTFLKTLDGQAWGNDEDMRK